MDIVTCDLIVMQQAFFPAISILSLAILGCSISLSVKAQVIPDGTTSTTVNQNENNFTIEQGDRVGDNLFHSFNEFSVPTLGSAVFNNAGDIANIFSRVTGSSISNIDGLLGANGTANLYLINPNGIIFGENASLNLGGSFFASTADSLLFEGDTEFSAVNPQAPPLLEVNIPIGARFRDNPGDIVNRSVVQNSEEEVIGLEVLSSKNLTFLGGNLNFEGGHLTARGGNIELGGLSQAGTVDIDLDSNLNFPENTTRADIILSDASEISARGSGGGNININARNLTLEAEEGEVNSRIEAGISSDSTSANDTAGDITIDANNLFLNNSGIINGVEQEAIGNGGNVEITTDSFSIINGAFVSASTSGQGNAGIVEINSNSISIDGGNSDGFAGGIFSQVSAGAIGNSGEINIITGNLTLANGTDILASTFGEGNAGNVTITASDSITIDGEDSNGEGSAISSQVNPEAIGNGGDIEVASRTINLNDGGQIVANTFGEGDSGNIDIDAINDIKIDGEDSSGFVSEVGSSVTAEALGSGGDITINTGNLAVTNGAEVSSGTRGQGNAGNVTITASNSINVDGEDSGGFPSEISSSVGTEAIGNGGNVNIATGYLSITNGGEIETTSFNQGNAGFVEINASDSVTVDGEDSEGSASSISSDINGGVGDAGGVNISTNSLFMTNGGFISSSNAGQGIARLVEINATDSISIDGTTSEGFSSSIRNQVLPQAEGNSEGIKLTTSNLNLTDGAVISSASSGQGDAGLIEINATKLISVDGESFDGFSSIISSQVDLEGIGNAGGVNISTDKLSLTNGGQIDSSTLAEGNAGLIVIDASDSITIDGSGSDEVGSRIISSVDSEAVGNSEGINITTNNLDLTNGGNIDASTFGNGNSGSTRVSATEFISIGEQVSNSSNTSFISSRVNSGAEGDAGSIDITTSNLTLANGAAIDATTFGNGNAGLVVIEASESIAIDGEGSNGFSSVITSSVQSSFTDAGDFMLAEGDAGGVSITTGSLTLTNGGRILSSSSGQGNAGLIEIDAVEIVTVDGESSNGSSSNINSSINNTFASNGEVVNPITFEELVVSEGVTINTSSLLLTDGGLISTSILGQGDAGDITVNASESIIIDGRDAPIISEVEIDIIDIFRGGLTSSLLGGNGSGGDVNVSTNQLTINNGSITADDSLFIFDNPDLDSGGQPGNIKINANSINLNDRAFIRAFTRSETGNSANIDLTVAEDITLRNNSSISAQALENANGGNVTINVNDGFILAFPNQNNDIIANAAQGNGGNIEIFTQAIFGLAERNSTPPNQTNDIDASSEFGLQGDFSLNTPDFDPTTGLINLPASVGDASDRLSQNPCQQGVGSEFIVTGKGGLPPNVNESVNSESARVGLIEPIETKRDNEETRRLAEEETGRQEENSDRANIPAQGWVFNDKGEVTLTAYKTTDTETERSSQKVPHSCSVSSFQNR